MRKKRTLTKNDILTYIELINEKLAMQDMFGEINICGGAAMTLVYDARESTYDIDALYKPKDTMVGIIAEIAKEHGLGRQWLNDDVAMFTNDLEELTSSTYLKLSNLTVEVVDAKYLLAMKLLAAREDSQDLHDASILINHMQIKSVDELHSLIDSYYKGMYHPQTLQVSKAFAKAAIKLASQLATSIEVPEGCKNSVLAEVSAEKERRKSAVDETGNIPNPTRKKT